MIQDPSLMHGAWCMFYGIWYIIRDALWIYETSLLCDTWYYATRCIFIIYWYMRRDVLWCPFYASSLFVLYPAVLIYFHEYIMLLRYWMNPLNDSLMTIIQRQQFNDIYSTITIEWLLFNYNYSNEESMTSIQCNPSNRVFNDNYSKATIQWHLLNDIHWITVWWQPFNGNHSITSIQWHSLTDSILTTIQRQPFKGNHSMTSIQWHSLTDSISTTIQRQLFKGNHSMTSIQWHSLNDSLMTTIPSEGFNFEIFESIADARASKIETLFWKWFNNNNSSNPY